MSGGETGYSEGCEKRKENVEKRYLPYIRHHANPAIQAVRIVTPRQALQLCSWLRLHWARDMQPSFALGADVPVSALSSTSRSTMRYVLSDYTAESAILCFAIIGRNKSYSTHFHTSSDDVCCMMGFKGSSFSKSAVSAS